MTVSSSLRQWWVVSRAPLVLAFALALGACKKEEAAPSATPAAAPAVTAVSSRVSAMSVDELREYARKAHADNRLYAPAEDNAVEYYLGLRDKLPGDAAVTGALLDLLPMTVIAIEQSVNREDFAEAQRLAAVLEKGDPNHPELARLKNSITAKQAEVAKRAEQQVLTAAEEARKQVELEKKRAEQQKQQQELAAKQLAAQQAARQAAQRLADQQAAKRETAQKREAEQSAAAQRAAEQGAGRPQAPTRAPQKAAQPTASAGDLRPLSQPAPRYPPDALLANKSGKVLVEFTVGTDGNVTSARVVRSDPPRTFDREAVNAVRKWRFQPVPAPVTTRRTINFDLIE